MKRSKFTLIILPFSVLKFERKIFTQKLVMGLNVNTPIFSLSKFEPSFYPAFRMTWSKSYLFDLLMSLRVILKAFDLLNPTAMILIASPCINQNKICHESYFNFIISICFHFHLLQYERRVWPIESADLYDKLGGGRGWALLGLAALWVCWFTGNRSLRE